MIESNHHLFKKNILDYQGTIYSGIAFKLLKSNLSDDFKIQLCRIIDDNTVANESFCELSAPYFLKLGFSSIERDVAETLIHFLLNEELSLKLFGKYYAQYSFDHSLNLLTQKLKVLKDEPRQEKQTWNEKIVMQALQLFPPPISTISEYGKKPLIPFTEKNRLLLNILKERMMISSYKQEVDSLRVFTKKSKRQ
ncbi:hypothetical protein [Agaribacter marinus]|uniref:Uncharacterized protein n=1 Tax=Agaribacter marinus TaxID=1431249 RepID=A0AA37SZU5_9ALTE|nr:hypothetical protein [Agaribacter marinus]GLR71021.1 hypothetical protein GCM10007852_19290 [Agaribacter marinus]